MQIAGTTFHPVNAPSFIVLSLFISFDLIVTYSIEKILKLWTLNYICIILVHSRVDLNSCILSIDTGFILFELHMYNFIHCIYYIGFILLNQIFLSFTFPLNQSVAKICLINLEKIKALINTYISQFYMEQFKKIIFHSLQFLSVK